MAVRVEMDAIDRRNDRDGREIKKTHVPRLSDPSDGGTKAPGRLGPTREQIAQPTRLDDRGRSHDEDLWWGAPESLRGADQIDQHANSGSDVVRGYPVARLKIIDAKRDHHRVKRPMAFKARQEIGPTVLVYAFDRIVMHGGTTGKPFLNDAIPGTETRRDDAGPTLIRTEAGNIPRPAHRLRAMGVRIAVTEDADHVGRVPSIRD